MAVSPRFGRAACMASNHCARARAVRQLLLSLGVIVLQWMMSADQPVNLSMQLTSTLTAANFDTIFMEEEPPEMAPVVKHWSRAAPGQGFTLKLEYDASYAQSEVSVRMRRHPTHGRSREHGGQVELDRCQVRR
tara:strand:+ start:278 stop:679 length:402 start_codon:yes stop_codon:yes gene_type:complete